MKKKDSSKTKKELLAEIKSLRIELEDVAADLWEAMDETNEAKSEIHFLKKLLKQNGIIARKLAPGDSKNFVSENVPIRIPKDMSEENVEATFAVGEQIIKWLKDNNVELTDPGDLDDN